MRASFLTNKAQNFAGSVDPRVKLGLCVAGSIAGIILKSPLSLGLMLAASTAMALTAARPATILKVCLFMTLMLTLCLGFSWIISLAVPDLVKWNLGALVLPFLRMLIVITLLMTFALSTPVQEISRMLQSFRLPGFLSLTLSVIIRFIPSFIDDCKQVAEAAKLRPGKSFLSFWRCLFVPLVFRVLASADDLAVAAELKGMSAVRKAALPPLDKFRRRDAAITMGAVVILFLAFALQIWLPLGIPAGRA